MVFICCAGEAGEEESEEMFLTITAEESGCRIDKVLACRYADSQSRTYFQFLIEAGAVLLNGAAIKKRSRLKAGDEVAVRFITSPALSLEPEAIPLSILYEDEHLLAINKPSGMVVHPAPGNWTATFVNALIYHCQQQDLSLEGVGGELQRPGIVHRLDKDTTGVLLAAKTALAHRQISAQFAARTVYKEYLAIAVGHPGHGTITAPIGRNPVSRQQMAVVDGGRAAVTHYETIAVAGELSLLKVVLETGRTHQIRVHMRHIGAPLLGDPVYGQISANRKHSVYRQMLHARYIKIVHPISGDLLELEAPQPEDFVQLHWATA